MNHHLEQKVLRRTISTTAGPITGLFESRVATFRGIPYAEAPIGDLRFAPPSPRPDFRDAFDATQWGATPQRITPGFFIPEPSVSGGDVLNLNVFTPSSAIGAGPRLPVMVWIHGGGYFSGSSSGSWYDGRKFAEAGIIVVSISYRLGVEGFAELPDQPSNRGVLDWIAALEWVQEHISSFGGDPDRVTIAGQSAGGGAVHCLMATPLAKGLFRGAWALSGVLEVTPVTIAIDRTSAFAKHLDIVADSTGFAQIEDRVLQEHLMKFAPGLYFTPVLDDSLFPKGLIGGMRRFGENIPLVVGTTADEVEFDDALATIGESDSAALLAGLGIDRATAARAYRMITSTHRVTSSRLITEAVFRAVVPAIADIRLNSTASTWAYDYRWGPMPSALALHCAEIPVFFGLTEDSHVMSYLGPVPQTVSDEFHKAAERFIVSGNPGWKPVGQDLTHACHILTGPKVSDGRLVGDMDNYAVARTLSTRWQIAPYDSQLS